LLQNLTLGQYCPGGSPVHRLDPRTKVLALIPVIVGITVKSSPVLLGGYSLFLAVLVLLSRVPFRLFVRQVKPFLWLIGLTLVLHALLTKGSVLFHLPVAGLAVSREGVYYGFLFGLRLLLLIAFSLLLMFTTAPTEMTDGIEKLMRPLKRIGLPADRYTLMLGISFRFIPILFEEAERIQKAQNARGADFEGNIIARIHHIGAVVIPLFISVFSRADALALALEARGFTIGVRRTHYHEMHFRLPDGIACIIVAALTTGVFLT